MIIKNVKVYTPQKNFVPGVVVTRDGRIHDVLLGEDISVNASEEEPVLDGEGSF